MGFQLFYCLWNDEILTQMSAGVGSWEEQKARRKDIKEIKP